MTEPVFTPDDLETAPTTAEARSTLYVLFARLGLSVTSWKPGAWPRTVSSAVAIIYSQLAKWVPITFKSGWVETATGPWLELAALYLRGYRKVKATFASGYVSVSNPTTKVYLGIEPGDFHVSSSTIGKTYTNADALDLGAGATVTGIAIVADTIGASSNAGPGAIDTVDSHAGCTCTNPLAVVGLDDEGDGSVRANSARRLSSLSSMGPTGAYETFAMFDRYGAPLKRPDGVVVSVNRVYVVSSSATNVASVVVASAAGPVTGTTGDPATDLGTVYLNLLRLAKPWGVTLALTSASTRSFTPAYTLVVDDTIGMTDGELKTACDVKLVEFCEGVKIGGYVLDGTRQIFAEGVRSAIKSANDKILSVTLDTFVPTILSGEVLTLGTTTLTAVNRITV